MPHDIIPRSFFDFPNMRLMSIWEDEDNLMSSGGNPGGLSISEDESYVYIDAAIPGVNPDEVEMTYHNGILKIHGKINEEKKERKNYRMMTSEFSYQVAVREIDQNEEPEATCKNGILHVRFTKSRAAQPKKITVKK
jgi:HSP20 family protein